MTSGERKDRLIQTRVPEKLETTLKREARRRRTTVSQMIRNLLEDTFHLVDGVVSNVDQIVSDSVELAQQVRRVSRRSPAVCRDPLPDAGERLAGVEAWNEVVLNRSVPCAKCGAELPRGSRAYAGLGGADPQSRAWLCARAVEALDGDERGDD